MLFMVSGFVYYNTPHTTPSPQNSVIKEPSQIDLLNRPAIKPVATSGRLILNRMDAYPHDVIGHSVKNREIRAYRFGTGDRKIIFVGALHGGYVWNTALLAYQLIDFYSLAPELVPSDLQLIVIPVANPDGLHEAVGSWERFNFLDAPQFELATEIGPQDVAYDSRFNANKVDLNRNFDCNRNGKTAGWRQYVVDAGPTAFSEPESIALRDFFLQEVPKAVVFYNSASNGVYPSSCNSDPLPGTLDLQAQYSAASGYPSYKSYPYYDITGDAADWLSTKDIPAITVELSNHSSIEWEKNLWGIDALIAFYSDVK
jgi:hypothetical protein